MTDLAIVIENRKYRPVLEKEGCCANGCPLFRKLPSSLHRDCATWQLCKTLADQEVVRAFGWYKANFDGDVIKKTQNWHVVWQDCGEEY